MYNTLPGELVINGRLYVPADTVPEEFIERVKNRLVKLKGVGRKKAMEMICILRYEWECRPKVEAIDEATATDPAREESDAV